MSIIKEVKKKIRSAKGFTLVELMVVLVILAILATLAGAGIIAYVRLARFEHNESNARTVFQTAQIALTRKDTGGDMDTFLNQLRETGLSGGHFTAEGLSEQFGDEAADKAQTYNSRIFALYYDKNAPDSASSQMVYDLLSPYVYDETLFNASIVVEIDSMTGQVYSAFYDTVSDKLRFAADVDSAGATPIDDRSYSYRRHNSLVGYYSAEDTVNVVALSQTRLKVKNPQLINNETLTLNWSGNSKNGDLDTIYDAAFYTSDGKPLFKLEITWAEIAGSTSKNAAIKVYKPVNADNADEGWSTTSETYTFPLSYSKGRFILTLDAMCDANLLRAAENDNAQQTSTKTTLFSITRLTNGAKDIYAVMKARPYKGFENTYTESKEVNSNTENTLFALGSNGTEGTLKYFRHLYNLRWVNSGNYTFNTGTLLAASQNTTLDWTGGSVTVYCAGENGGEPTAKVPSRTGEVVAWPTIPALGENVSLTGSSGSGHVIISNLQLRGSSVAAQPRTKDGLADHQKRDHYVGLIGENNGTLKNITLRDPDVQVNAEVKTEGEQDTAAMPMNANATQYLQLLAETDTAYREEIWSVGALAGVDTGSITDCTVDRSSRRGAEAKVTAALTFSSYTIGTARKNSSDTTTIYDEPHGIGGLVGFAMPKTDAALTGLTLAENVTVAGLLQDADAAENTGTTADTGADAAEKARYNAIASESKTQTLWRAVGVGGVAGVLDATNLTGSANAANFKDITNKATVVSNGFAGGIAGNLYTTAADNTDNTDNTLTGLANQGTVLAGANYHGSEAMQSAVLGQFFGGIAGYARDLVLQNCHSATRSGLSETTLTALVKAGYATDGTLNENSPLKGDFVGGLVGFGRDIQMNDCYTESGYVLGRSFVGGFVGGFVGSNLRTTGGVNNSYVFGNRYVGGIVSVNGSSSTIESMTNKGLVAGLGANAAYVGGIAGVNDASWGAQRGETATAAQLVDSSNSMSTVEVTDRNKIALLKNLSIIPDGTENGTALYADFVGGVAGYNGTNGKICWTETSANGATLGAVLYGGSYVGGVAGYNDATASIVNEHTRIPSVTGTVVATGDCVGGFVGLNAAASLPAVQVSANRIEGVHFVGGVVGANLPENSFAFVSADGTSAAAGTIGSGRLVADGVAGGILGYNRVITAESLQTALGKTGTLAANLRTLLPTFGGGNALNETRLTSATNAVTLTGLSNQFNIYANAYVGGIIGYNSASTSLTLDSASNGNASQAQSYGGLALAGSDQEIANPAAYTLAGGVSLRELDTNYNGYFAGGIIGYAAEKTTLQNCTNYGGVQHPVAAGGIAGVNDGTITGCSMVNSLGNQQDAYRYLGGIAGINSKTIINSAPAAGSSIRGGLDIGGVAGYNTKTGVITLNSANGSVYGITATGGVAGYNAGTIAPGQPNAQITVAVSGTSQTGGLAGVNAAGGRIGGADGDTYNSFTIANAARISSTSLAGGAAGENYGTIYGITNSSGSVQASGQYAGGITGRNSGTIQSCTHNASGSRVLYTGGAYAGGIAGINEKTGLLQNVTVSGSVTAANGEAGGVTAHNYGTIKKPTVADTTVSSTANAIGGVAAVNEAGATIEEAVLKPYNSKTSLSGPATKVGGLVGYNAGTVTGGEVRSGSLDLSRLTAADNTVSAGGAVGENTGTTKSVTVQVSLTDNMAKYRNLGGVAGSSSGTLDSCTYTGTIGTGTSAGLTAVGSTAGGIVGLNEVAYDNGGAVKSTGKVKDCIVGYINLQVQGASNVGSSQAAATKINNAAHIGGIAGRNCGEITGSTVGTNGSKPDTLGGKGSIITARHGFVGGVAGSNSGTITTSGGEGTKELVTQINEWLKTPTKEVTNEDGSKTTVVDTAKQNENLNQMVRVLTGNASGDTETSWQKKFTDLKGVDAITNGGYGSVYTSGLGQNQLTVSLHGGSSKGDFANGYLGGITGFNDVSGKITDSASGQWFVYADNINQSWGAVGGIIGQNESNADTTSGLVNLAAVRRYVRGDNGDSDDDANSSNNKYASDDDPLFNNYVGGVIGTQENRTGDRWTLDTCVNLGTVFNSRSNNAGGVLAYWLSYGGTLQNCYNFGNITTNANSGGSASGTVGGIAGYFDAPIAGTAANLYRCSNYGSVYMNKKNTGANDVGGVFGKVEMGSGHTDDAMTINIIECVNGANVELNAKSMTVGIFAYLGPWGAVPNVEVNIDRCRNYCTNMTAYGNAFRVGIAGNRGSGQTSNAATTITNCFTLAMDTWTAPVAYTASNNSVENLTGSNNYYMTVSDNPGNSTSAKPSSFAGYSGIAGLQDGLGKTKPTGPWPAETGREKEDDKNSTVKINAHRLYAGVYSAANAETDGDNYYTYFAMLPKLNRDNTTLDVSLNCVTGSSSFITVQNGKSFSDRDAMRYVLAFDTGYNATSTGRPDENSNNSKSGYVGKILLLFNEADGDGKTSKGDITDEALQNYYMYLLDNSAPIAPTNLKVERSDNTGTDADSIYGRYNVTWKAPASGSPIYYHVTVYETNENGDRIGKDSLLEADVYDTKFTFESRKEWQGKYFNVSVAGVNSKGTGEPAMLDTPKRFAQALPTPQLEVRLMRNPDTSDNSKAYVQMLTLVNAADYEDITDWSVDVTLTTVTRTKENGQIVVKETVDEKGTTTFHAGYTQKNMEQYTCSNVSTQYLRAVATANDENWMRSAQYNESIYVPGLWDMEDPNHEVNPGLAAGKLTASLTVNGSSMDDLSISVKLKFDPLAEMSPVYRVMLLGKALNSTIITDKDGNTADLQGQYITLAAQERTIPTSEETITFTNLPDDTLSAYEDWIVLAVPVNSGVGDAVTRWSATVEDAVNAIKTAQAGQPVAWYQGMGIIRNGSSYTYENLTPLYFAVSKTGYTPTPSWAQIAKGDLGTSGKHFPDNTTYGARIFSATDFLNVAAAPTITNVPGTNPDGSLQLYDKYTINAANELEYTFTWEQPGETGNGIGNSQYILTLYGITESTDATGHITTAEEPITLPDGASSKVKYDPKTGTYSYTLNVDTDLAENSWRFDKVRLRVTRDTTGTTSIGAADTATYAVLRRLAKPGAPVSFINVDTSNAEQLRYEIGWTAVPGANHYQLFAQVQNDDGSLGDAFELFPADTDKNGNVPLITTTQTTVDLEAYQGKKLVFYVVACPANGDTSVLQSPNGALSALQTIIKRTAAPAINSVSFSWTGKAVADTLPLMNSFCNNLSIQMNVGSADAASYYFTGYLFDTPEDYAAACTAATTWMTTPTKANLDALNAALEKGTLMIPASTRTVGKEAAASGDTVSYTVTPDANGFTMRPADANRYLLPALRAMVQGGGDTSSSWCFYVPQGTELHLPLIQLDKPENDGISSLTAVESTVTGSLYASQDGLEWDPATADITIRQYAVQWPAVNEYTDVDGITRNFAGEYRFHVTPGKDMPGDDPNKDGYDIRFTVAQADTTVENEDGTTTIIPRGEIRKVEKLPANTEDTPEKWLDITDAARHIENKGTDDEYTWYDLSIAMVQEQALDSEGNPAVTDTGLPIMTDVQRSQPITLTGHHAMESGDNPIYKIPAVPKLRMAEMSDGSLGYLVTLPDLSERADRDDDVTTALAQYTNALTVWAVGDADKTNDSEHLEVTITRSGSTQALPEAALPVVLAAPRTNPTVEADPVPPAQDEPAGAGEGFATLETADPAA